MPRTARRRVGLSRLLEHVPGPRRRLVGLGLAAALSAACSAGGWLFVRSAIDDGMRAGDERRLVLTVVGYVAVNLIGWALAVALTRGLARLGQAIVLDVRQRLFDHLTGLSLRYFGTQRAGWIIARLTSDVDALMDVLGQGLVTLVANGLTLIVALIALFVLDVRLALVTLVILPPTLLLTRWFQRRAHEAFGTTRTTIAAVTAHLAESVGGMAIVQAYGQEGLFGRRFDELNAENRRTNLRAQGLMSVFFPGVELLGAVATVAVLGVGAVLYDDGGLTVGTLVAAVGLLSLLFQPLQELSELYGQVQSAGAAMEKITTVLDTSADVADRPGARPLARVDGEIELERITFAYGAEPVLRDVTFRVPAGGCLALVGESGGGKSTLAKLVARFYDPDAGAVRVDGHDLREVELASYRRQLGIVLQDPFLFSGTIADNVRFGRPEATDAEVRAAAEAVGVDRVADRLEGGLEHVVREGGAGLSAGERQLISIARALLADPRVLILDEATSNIDRPTERVIERALDRLLQGRTSIIIAHRLATVRRADEILVVDHGRILQRGREAELMAVDGPFRRLASGLAPAGGSAGDAAAVPTSAAGRL